MRVEVVGQEIGRALKVVASICPSNTEGGKGDEIIPQAYITDGVYFSHREGGVLNVWSCDMKRLNLWAPSTRSGGNLGQWVMPAKQAMSLAETATIIGGDMTVAIAKPTKDDPFDGFEVTLGGTTLRIPLLDSKKTQYDLGRSLPDNAAYGLSCTADPSSLLVALRTFRVRRSGKMSTFVLKCMGANGHGTISKMEGNEEPATFDMQTKPTRGFMHTFLHQHMKHAVESLVPLDDTNVIIETGGNTPLRLRPGDFPNVHTYVWKAI